MSKHFYAVTIYLEIEDADELQRAAALRAIDSGLSESEWAYTRTGINDDLIMMLDPGQLEGCSIIDTGVEMTHSFL